MNIKIGTPFLRKEEYELLRKYRDCKLNWKRDGILQERSGSDFMVEYTDVMENRIDHPRWGRIWGIIFNLEKKRRNL